MQTIRLMERSTPTVMARPIMAEFVAGTNLHDPNSKLRITNIARDSSSAAVTFTTEPNQRYQVEASSNFARWDAISGDIFPSGATATYDDSAGGTGAGQVLSTPPCIGCSSIP